MKGLLQSETLQDRRIHIEAIGGELRLVDGEEEIAFGDLLILRNVNRGDGSLLRNENARRSERRRQIARDRLFARVACEADEDDERADGDRQKPGEHLRRGGLKPADLAELAILLLKFESLGTKQGSCHGGTRQHQNPCPEVANSPARQDEGSFIGGESLYVLCRGT